MSEGLGMGRRALHAPALTDPAWIDPSRHAESRDYNRMRWSNSILCLSVRRLSRAADAKEITLDQGFASDYPGTVTDVWPESASSWISDLEFKAVEEMS
jgi:hypothetical protein